MAFNERATTRAGVLMQQLGEAGSYLGNQYTITGLTGVFQWSWVVDPVSGVTMERQQAKVKMLTADTDAVDLAKGDEMQWRDLKFRVQGLLSNDAGVTTVELARVIE